MTREEVIAAINNYVWQDRNGRLVGADLATDAIIALIRPGSPSEASAGNLPPDEPKDTLSKLDADFFAENAKNPSKLKEADGR